MFGSNILTTEGGEWKRWRKIAAPVISEVRLSCIRRRVECAYAQTLVLCVYKAYVTVAIWNISAISSMSGNKPENIIIFY